MVKIIKRYQLQAKNNVNEQKTEQLQQQLCEEIKHQAYQQGFELGLKQGEERGLIQAQEQADVRLKKLDDFILSLEQQIAETLRKQSPKLFDILASILPNFFIHNTVSKANIEFAINKALKEINDSERMTIKLSKEDYQLLQQGKIAIHASGHLKIEASDEVVLGGCLIETEKGIFDGRLENQMDKLKDILLDYKRQVINECN